MKYATGRSPLGPYAVIAVNFIILERSGLMYLRTLIYELLPPLLFVDAKLDHQETWYILDTIGSQRNKTERPKPATIGALPPIHTFTSNSKIPTKMYFSNRYIILWTLKNYYKCVQYYLRCFEIYRYISDITPQSYITIRIILYNIFIFLFLFNSCHKLKWKWRKYIMLIWMLYKD